MLILFLFQIAYSYDFPSIKKPKGGIFGWFTALSHMKNSFDNKTILGFRSNISEPDLKMIARDVSHYIKLKDLNISGEIAKAVDKYDPNHLFKKPVILLDDDKCENTTNNVYQFCHLFGIKLDLEEYGIPPEHVDILISNVVGYLPCGLLILVLGCSTILFYIIQLILSCFYCKPVEHSRPNIFSIIIFYTGDALVLIAAIIYFFSYSGINSMFSTLIDLDTVVPSMTGSLAKSLRDLTTTGIPNALGPLIDNVINISNSTFDYVNTTAESFIQPTLKLQDRMISNEKNNLGVFSIYNEKIKPVADSFYQKASENPKLENISEYFARQNWTNYTEIMQDFLDKEYELAEQLKLLNTFFDYLYTTIEPYQDTIDNLSYQEIKGTNKTVDELIDELESKTLYSFESFTNLNENTKDKRPLYRFICAVFFIYGIVLVAAPIFFGVQFMMHTRCSRCVACTISVYPIIATIMMFLVAVVFTGVGFADVYMSDQFEPALDVFLTEVVGVTIPQREVHFPLINITFYTRETYIGVLNLSKMVLPNPMHNLENFFFSHLKDGIAEALGLEKIIDLDRYGDEIGDFIIDLGEHFTLPKIVVLLFKGCRELFKLVRYFPRTIDGFFNWEIPMTKTTNELREQIKEMDPDALADLDRYLSEIDGYVDEMNAQYEIVLYQIYNRISDAFDKIEERLVNYIRTVMYDLGSIVRHLCKQVYPILNTIKIEPVIGPYAVVRNFCFYDLASTSAYLSAAATLMMFGLVVVVILMWIRRKGMLSGDDIQLRRNKSNKLDDVGPEKMAI